jgi:hypothetical protein
MRERLSRILSTLHHRAMSTGESNREGSAKVIDGTLIAKFVNISTPV